MKRSWYIMLTLGVALAASLLMTACTPASPFSTSRVGGPEIRVIAPAPNSTTTQGSTVIIRASIKDSSGIGEVSLKVNGQAAQTLDLSAQRVTELTQELFWTPELVGTYEIRVDAQNRDGDWGNSEPMVHHVVGPFARETVVAVTLPTVTPTPSVGEQGGGGSAIATESPICVPYGKFKCRPCASPHAPMYPHQCRDGSALVTDVTVPDGTVFPPGTTFDKTWRLKNTGTCTWSTGYQLAFVGGSQLSAPSSVNMPNEVPPGSTVDVTVKMVAPDASGTYRSNWRMRNPECSNLFGPTIYALIEVRSDTGDLPVITRFEVVPSSISQGQGATLFWEYSNGTSARLHPGDTAVDPTGSRRVTPGATTTYRLVVTNSAGSVERTTTLVVQPTSPVPSPPPTSPANLTITGTRQRGFDFTWVDTSNNEQGFRLYRLHDDGTREELASFPANTESRGIDGLDCDTSYRFYLVSYNERGESWPSNEAQGRTNPCDG